MTLYIASRFRNKQLVRAAATTLALRGIYTHHSWTEELASCSHEEAAKRDLYELDLSDGIVVLTTDCEAVPGGMHFEAGYAFGQGKKVYVVGPPVNIFYKHPAVTVVATLEELCAALS